MNEHNQKDRQSEVSLLLVNLVNSVTCSVKSDRRRKRLEPLEILKKHCLLLATASSHQGAAWQAKFSLFARLSVNWLLLTSVFVSTLNIRGS